VCVALAASSPFGHHHLLTRCGQVLEDQARGLVDDDRADGNRQQEILS